MHYEASATKDESTSFALKKIPFAYLEPGRQIEEGDDGAAVIDEICCICDRILDHYGNVVFVRNRQDSEDLREEGV